MRAADPTRRLELDEVVAELLVAYRNPDDWPADHRCVKSLGYEPSLGYDVRAGADGRSEVFKSACEHAEPKSLLDRLYELIEPGQRAVQENPGKAPSGPKGSPAPWSARPADLLDEVWYGAVDLHDTTRRVLGLKPEPEYGNRLIDGRGRQALRHLVADVQLLVNANRGAHWLVASDCPGRPQCTIAGEHTHPGAIEKRIRSWHGRALLITGHEQKRAKVGQVLNPRHPANAERPESPTFERGPAHPRGCGHPSCKEIRNDRANRYQPARCPWCKSVSLEHDPVTGHVECVRPSCRDDQGHRRMWTVDELAHLGLVIVVELGA